MLSVEEARAQVLNVFDALDPTEVALSDAVGGVLARDIDAPEDSPRFDNSAMDGYAVRSVDVAGASGTDPIVLRLSGDGRAGAGPSGAVEEGVALRVMTGAPIPRGADAVVPVEEASEDGNLVSIQAPAEPGRHIRRAGEDIEKGDRLMSAGTELGPGEVALLAAMGSVPVPVHRRPRVSVLVTGDELVEVAELPGPGQIRDSNSVALRALVADNGADLHLAERVPDDLDATIEALERAADGADLIVSSGGVAVGRYDFIKPAIEKLGRIDMWKVAMQPGKPVVLGEVRGIPLLGLPGNPVSVHISFEQFVRPALRKMRGHTKLLRPAISATLTEAIRKKPGRQHFVRVYLEHANGKWFATPTGAQGSHVMSSLVGCDGVAIFPASESLMDMGATVKVEVWRWEGEEVL